jgi:hypothetical protein
MFKFKVISKNNPASITMSSEYPTNDPHFFRSPENYLIRSPRSLVAMWQSIS